MCLNWVLPHSEMCDIWYCGHLFFLCTHHCFPVLLICNTVPASFEASLLRLAARYSHCKWKLWRNSGLITADWYNKSRSARRSSHGIYHILIAKSLTKMNMGFKRGNRREQGIPTHIGIEWHGRDSLNPSLDIFHLEIKSQGTEQGLKRDKLLE